jgi:hypothetical protein
MIKKLLFASMLTTFSVLGTMAQDIFIGTTDSFYYEWSKKPDYANGEVGPNGFLWNSNFGTNMAAAKDSVGAVTYGTPYEGTTHLEFYYDFNGWWCSGGAVLDKWDEILGSYPGSKDLTGATHLRLYWKAFSAVNPGNTLTFTLSDANGNGKTVVVCDSSNQATYVQKLIPIDSFVGTTSLNLAAVQKVNFAVSDGNNTWWMSNGASSGVFFLDAIQFVNLNGISNSTGTESYAAYPSPFTDETVIRVNSSVSAPMSIKVIDTKGTEVSASEGHFTNEEITLGKGLEKGIYFVHASYQNRVQVIKIVKM